MQNKIPVYLLFIDVEKSCYFISVDEWDFPFRGKPIPKNFNLPPHVLEPKKLPIRDFVEGVEFILVSQNAYNSLQLLVKEHAEFISIGKLRGKHYYLMNVLSIVDCLDIDKSKVNFDRKPGFSSVSWAGFIPEKVPEYPIFKVPQDRYHIFVTQPFVDCIRINKLSGIGFSDPSLPIIGSREPFFDDLPILF